MVTPAATVIPHPDPSIVTSEAIDRRVGNAESVLNAKINAMEKAVTVFHDDLTRIPTQLDRAIAAIRDLFDSRFQAFERDHVRLREEVALRDANTKDAVNTAFAASTEKINQTEALLIEQIKKLSEVTTERFAGVAAQFSERDTRTDQRAGDTKLAVDAAFAAAKEATSKIEAGFTKSIDGQQDLLNNTTQATNDKISDLKDRVTAIENRTIGLTTANTGNREVVNDASARLFAIISVVISAVAVLAVVAIALIHGR